MYLKSPQVWSALASGDNLYVAQWDLSIHLKVFSLDNEWFEIWHEGVISGCVCTPFENKSLRVTHIIFLTVLD